MADENQLLINKATFAGYEDVSINVEETRLNVWIRKAQELDLEAFLGDVFYFAVVDALVFNTDGTLNEADTPEAYKDLFLGKVYTNKANKKLRYPGIITALVYWSFARFIEGDSYRYTATGPVTKHHDQADPLKPSDLAKLVAQQRSVANAYANKIVAFLENNRTDYPDYRYSERNANSRQPGARIRGVDKTDVRGRGYYGNNLGDPFYNMIP